MRKASQPVNQLTSSRAKLLVQICNKTNNNFMNCEMLPECSTQKHSLEPGVFIIALEKEAIIE